MKKNLIDAEDKKVQIVKYWFFYLCFPSPQL